MSTTDSIGASTTLLRMPTRAEGWDGFPVAVESSPDTGSVDALFVHANGFCKELWRPITRTVSEGVQPFRWMSMDQRGHGDSGVGESPYEWDLVARDVVTLIGESRGLTGVGHSSGGAAIARAEILQPGLFDSLVLIEPILFPPPHGRHDIPLAAVTEQRRSVFADRQAAHDRFAARAFKDWDATVLDLYIDHGFRATDHGWELKCAPAVEADYYREGNNHDTWERLGEIDAPVVLVAGERSDSHHGPYLSQLQARFKRAHLEIVPDAGHLVPMEKPGTIADLVATTIR